MRALRYGLWKSTSILGFVLSFFILCPVSSGEEGELERLYAQKKYSEVIARYSVKTKELARNHLYLLAKSYYYLKRYNQSFSTFELLLQRDSKDVAALREWGKLLAEQKKWKEALAKLNQAIQINPNYEAAYISLGEVILMHKPKNYLELRLLYQDMLSRFGEKEDYLYKLCYLSVQEGQHDEAKKWCEKTLKKNPSHALAKVQLGQIWADQKEWEKADSYFSKVVNEISSSYDALLLVSDYWEKRGNKAKALEVLLSGDLSSCDQPTYFTKLAQMSCSLGQYEECYQAFERLCALQGEGALAKLRPLEASIRESRNKEWIGKFQHLKAHCKLGSSPSTEERVGG